MVLFGLVQFCHIFVGWLVRRLGRLKNNMGLCRHNLYLTAYCLVIMNKNSSAHIKMIHTLTISITCKSFLCFSFLSLLALMFSSRLLSWVFPHSLQEWLEKNSLMCFVIQWHSLKFSFSVLVIFCVYIYLLNSTTRVWRIEIIQYSTLLSLGYKHTPNIQNFLHAHIMNIALTHRICHISNIKYITSRNIN